MISKETYDKLQEYKEIGFSILKASEKLGLSYNTAYNWWNKTDEEFTSFQKKHEFMLDNYRQYLIEQIIEEKDLIISTLETIITDFTNTDAIEEKLKKLKEEEKQACEYIRLWVNENSRRVIDQQVYEEEYIKRAEKVKEIQNRISELANERTLQINRRKEAENSLKLIRENDVLTEFDEELFTRLVESITVFEDKLVFEWKDGRRVENEVK